jgi:hypothetical protein
MLRIHDAMANSKKIIINAISFIDLQHKLAKRPSWRILEISRLNFGFKAILQKKTTEERRRPPDTASPSRFNKQGHRNPSSIFSLTEKASPILRLIVTVL